MASYKEVYSGDFSKEDRDNSNSTRSDISEQKSETDLVSEGNLNKNSDETSNAEVSADTESLNNEGKLIARFYKKVIMDLMQFIKFRKKRISELQAKVSELVSGGDSENNFSKVIHRMGYLSMYAACHTGLVKKTIWSFLQDKKCTIFNTNQLKVVSLGGGPGCDLVGFCCALQETRNDVKEIGFKIIDSKNWKSEFKKMLKIARRSDFGSFSALLKEIKISSTFIGAELNTDGIFQDKALSSAIAEADFLLIVELENIVSNNWDKKLIKNVVDTMKAGSKFIFIYKVSIDLFENISRLHTIYDGYQEYEMPPSTPSEWINLSTSSDKAHICVFQKEVMPDEA